MNIKRISTLSNASFAYSQNKTSWLPFAIKTQIGAGQKCLAWQQERTQAQKRTGTYIRILEAESYHYYLNSPLKKIVSFLHCFNYTKT